MTRRNSVALVSALAAPRLRTPRLHVVTDDAVLSRPHFVPAAARLLERFGPRLALHLRGHATAPAALLAQYTGLREVSAMTGAQLVVNDRVDVALAAGASAVQLGARSLPVAAVRRILPGARIGCSVHDAAAAGEAAGAGTDWLLVGTTYDSASHPGARVGGTALIAACAGAAGGAGDGGGTPVLAIGGVTPARVAELAAAGAYGVAVLGGVWHVADPTAAAHAYIVAIEKAWDEA